MEKLEQIVINQIIKESEQFCKEFNMVENIKSIDCKKECLNIKSCLL